MRLISLLLAVVIIGFIVYKQLGSGRANDTPVAETLPGIETPKVPTTPQQIPKFEHDVNAFMQDAAAERDKKMREQEGNQ